MSVYNVYGGLQSLTRGRCRLLHFMRSRIKNPLKLVEMLVLNLCSRIKLNYEQSSMRIKKIKIQNI